MTVTPAACQLGGQVDRVSFQGGIGGGVGGAADHPGRVSGDAIRHVHDPPQRPDHGRVADQDADPAHLGGDPGHRASHLGGVSRVGREHPGGPPAVPHRRGHLIELINRARQQGDPGSSRGQLEGDGPPDAPASAGHQGELTIKKPRHWPFRPSAVTSSAARICPGSERVE